MPETNDIPARAGFVRAYPPAVAAPGEAIHLPIRSGDLLMREEGGDLALLRAESAAAPDGALYLGTLGGVPCLAYPASPDNDGVLTPVGLRSLYGRVSDDEYALAGYAGQMLHWRTISRFCPRCGQATEDAGENTWARRCPACGYSHYPPVSPAVLILVHDGAGRILLCHKPGWGDRYSILAGFVEPGESLEGCVAREAEEEVGLPVTEIAYRGSQPWPFPHQVMIGFTARCPDPSLPFALDEAELDDARWFTVDDLPELPGPLSLSRQLIDAWVAEQREGRGRPDGG
jgi:NTP pyrophosphohydrolases containing a Zn-finger, probably nucleic-acid-binding